MRTHYCAELSAALIGKRVSIAGWAHRRRDHGGVIFIDLRDRDGLAQVVCDPDRAEAFKAADRVRSEFVLRVTGLVRARPAGTANPNLKSGEVEVLAHEVEILNPSAPPPFQIDDDNLAEETRPLDLRLLPNGIASAQMATHIETNIGPATVTNGTLTDQLARQQRAAAARHHHRLA